MRFCFREGAGKGTGRGAGGNGVKCMINLSNIRELNQISCIWKVLEGFATSGRVRGRGRAWS